MRTAPSLPFDDVKDQVAGTTNGPTRFLESAPAFAGPERGAGLRQFPVRSNYNTRRGKESGCVVASGEWRVASERVASRQRLR